MAKANASAVPAVKKVRKLPRNWKWGVAFITPWIIGFLAFQLYPLLASLYYSFTDFSVLADGKWVGVENYVKLFTKDKHFLKSLWLTVKYAIMSVPVKLAFALFIAMLLNMKLRGINMFRTIYYLPSIMGGSVAVSILWKFLFMQDGIVNKALAVFHIPAVSWLGDPNMALVTVSLLVEMCIRDSLSCYMDFSLGSRGSRKETTVPAPFLLPICRPQCSPYARTRRRWVFRTPI